MLKLLQSIFTLSSQTESTESLEQLQRKIEELTAENLKLRREKTQLLEENLRLSLNEPPNINQELDEEDLATIELLLEKCQQLEDYNLNSPSRHK